VPKAQDYDVAVAGAGIVGASVAWHLARRGLKVAVIDAIGPAAAASGASDGAVSVASKKPGLVARLAVGSLLYTGELARADGPLAASFRHRPSYFFASDDRESAALDSLGTNLAALGGPVRIVSDGSREGLGGMGGAVLRLLELTGEGHMPGYHAVRAYLAQPGITPIWPAQIVGVEADDSGVTLLLQDQKIRVGKLVAALGVSTPRLFPALPVRPRAGQLIVTDRGPVGALPGALTAASYLIAKTVEGQALPLSPVVIDPLSTGQFLVGSSREEHGDASMADFATIRQLLGRAVSVWPALAQRRVIRVFAGIRAAVADGLPIVGALPGAARILVATGFEGDGICLSALVGREVAQMAADEPLSELHGADIAALSARRFVQPEQRAALA
jgi:glycine/D-amino acid oxidase-like deaminating enzyme